MSRRLVLAIEISNPSAAGAADSRDPASPGPGVAVGELDSAGGVHVLHVEPLLERHRHDDDLVPAIDRALAAAHASPTDLARVAVSVGPGGFTSVRIAAAAGQMIALATGAEAVALPTALVLAQRARRTQIRLGVQGPLAILLAGKGASAWAQPMGDAPGPLDATRPGRLDPLPPPRIITAGEAASLGVRAVVADRFIPADIRRACEDAGQAVLPPEYDPAAAAEVSGWVEPVEPSRLLPIYPREPEAVTRWRELHG